MAVRVLLSSYTFAVAKRLKLVQGRNALENDDWKAAAKAFIDALWVDQTANAVNAISWIGLCKVCAYDVSERVLPYFPLW
jgi:hypothetical protein